MVNVGGDERPEFTPDLRRIDDAVVGFWRGVWTAPPRNRQALEELFLATVPILPEWRLSEITAVMISEEVTRLKGCAGNDGWTNEELKAAAPFHDQWAEIMMLMEQAWVVPDIARVGDVTMILKAEEDASFKKMHPISVLALFHRIYASVRLRGDLFGWQERVIGSHPCMGCRLGAGCKDLTWPMGFQAERTEIEEDELSGASYDLEKCFDSLPT